MNHNWRGRLPKKKRSMSSKEKTTLVLEIRSLHQSLLETEE